MKQANARCGLLGLGVLALLLGGPVAAVAQDSEAGKAVFASQCAICHSPEPGRNLAGPSLFAVVGRPSGTVEGFAYSDANRNSGIVWTREALDLYLTAPKGVVPHNAMIYGGVLDAGKRASLIAYLATLHR